MRSQTTGNRYGKTKHDHLIRILYLPFHRLMFYVVVQTVTLNLLQNKTWKSVKTLFLTFYSPILPINSTVVCVECYFQFGRNQVKLVWMFYHHSSLNRTTFYRVEYINSFLSWYTKAACLMCWTFSTTIFLQSDRLSQSQRRNFDQNTKRTLVHKCIIWIPIFTLVFSAKVQHLS